jgi:hypothetical protein
MPRQRTRQLNREPSASASEPASKPPAGKTPATRDPKAVAFVLKRPPEATKPQVRARSPKAVASTEPIKSAPTTKRVTVPELQSVPKSAGRIGAAKTANTSGRARAKTAVTAAGEAVTKLGSTVVPPLPQKAKKMPVPAGASAQRAPVRAHRIVDLSQPHNTNTQEGALLFALQILSGAEATWEHLRELRPSDAELEEAMDRYFPVLLGFHAERQKGFYMGRKPEPFFLWGNESTAGGYLTGAALLKKVRAVLRLADRTKKE